MSVEAVLTRIAAIEARFGAARPPAGTGVDGTAFAAELQSVLASSAGTAAVSGSYGALTVGSTSGTVSGPYAALFEAAGAAHGVDPRLLAAVAQVESGMDPRAVSPAGARGLMQLMPATAAGLGVTDPFDPAQAIDGAARLLRSHLDRFGSVELALAAYNAGAGAVARHGGIPPYQETQAYVRRVLARYGAAS